MPTCARCGQPGAAKLCENRCDYAASSDRGDLLAHLIDTPRGSR